jgi:hypothetical protein
MNRRINNPTRREYNDVPTEQSNSYEIIRTLKITADDDQEDVRYALSAADIINM